MLQVQRLEVGVSGPWPDRHRVRCWVGATAKSRCGPADQAAVFRVGLLEGLARPHPPPHRFSAWQLL